MPIVMAFDACSALESPIIAPGIDIRTKGNVLIFNIHLANFLSIVKVPLLSSNRDLFCYSYLEHKIKVCRFG